MEGTPITIITYHCVSTSFMSVVIARSVQVVLSAVGQLIIVKFLTNENFV